LKDDPKASELIVFQLSEVKPERQQNGVRPCAAKAHVKIGRRRIAEGRIAGGKVFVTEVKRHVVGQFETHSRENLPGKHHVILTADNLSEIAREATDEN
jgi:hypothetical protein